MTPTVIDLGLLEELRDRLTLQRTGCERMRPPLDCRLWKLAWRNCKRTDMRGQLVLSWSCGSVGEYFVVDVEEVPD